MLDKLREGQSCNKLHSDKFLEFELNEEVRVGVLLYWVGEHVSKYLIDIMVDVKEEVNQIVILLPFPTLLQWPLSQLYYGRTASSQV